MQYEKLIEDYRNGILENIHVGQICIIDEHNNILHHVGDETAMTYLRSAAKPFQAMPVFMHQADEHFSIDERDASLFMASQRGEEYHIKGLESLLNQLDLDENVLICSKSFPLNEKPKEKYIYNHGQKRKLLHNCAGKHLGFLALTKLLGKPLATYSELKGSVQQMSLETMAYMADIAKEDMKLGIDGCGFPVYAMPLNNIAKAYLKLACPDLIDDQSYRIAAEKVCRLMNENPEMIASNQFVCTTLLNDPNIIAKGGAKGVYGIGLKNERVGIALKVLDGSEGVWPNIIAGILERINYKNNRTIDALYKLSPKELTNDGDVIVGQRKAIFAF